MNNHLHRTTDLLLRAMFVLLIIPGCSRTEESAGNFPDTSLSDQSDSLTERAPTAPRTVRSPLEQIIHDTAYTRWNGEGTWSSPVFIDDSLNYEYHGQCAYCYPVSIVGDEIVMYWDRNMDCVFDAMLDTTFGLKNHPLIGEPFARFRLVNDSTLSADYEYPEWVERYHRMATQWKRTPDDPVFPKWRPKEPIFPERFVVVRE